MKEIKEIRRLTTRLARRDGLPPLPFYCWNARLANCSKTNSSAVIKVIGM
jgi:hypothetical protein